MGTLTLILVIVVLLAVFLEIACRIVYGKFLTTEEELAAAKLLNETTQKTKGMLHLGEQGRLMMLTYFAKDFSIGHKWTMNYHGKTSRIWRGGHLNKILDAWYTKLPNQDECESALIKDTKHL